jgi:hypothetical protein
MRRTLALTLAAVACLAIAVAPAASAKTPKRLSITQTVGQMPGGWSGPPADIPFIGPTINVGKKYRGLKIRDVNVTFQTTGTAPGVAGGLNVWITAPNEATQTLVLGLSGQNVGPLTLDDESPNSLGLGLPCPTPDFLCEPYIGSARALDGEDPLAVLDGGRVRGPWTLTFFNFSSTPQNILESWRIDVVTGRPFRTK